MLNIYLTLHSMYIESACRCNPQIGTHRGTKAENSRQVSAPLAHGPKRGLRQVAPVLPTTLQAVAFCLGHLSRWAG